MATCVKVQPVYGFTTPTGSTRTTTNVLAIDGATALASCPYVMVNATEYADMVPIRIDNAADAQTIAGAFAVLLAIAFGYRAIKRAMDTGHLSDEKH